jgi:hypothetical protein
MRKITKSDALEWFYEHDNEWQNDIRTECDTTDDDKLADYLIRNYKYSIQKFVNLHSLSN